jgi:hypothetical protein
MIERSEIIRITASLFAAQRRITHWSPVATDRVKTLSDWLKDQ